MSKQTEDLICAAIAVIFVTAITVLVVHSHYETLRGLF